MSDKVWNFLGVCFWVVVIGWILIASVNGSSSTDTSETVDPYCVTETIEYETERVESEDYEDGYEETTTNGENGEREICYDENDEVVSNEITTEPTKEIVTVGIAEPEPEYYYSDYSERSGAICSDGSYSSATGRGACSWHGGVSEWLY